MGQGEASQHTQEGKQSTFDQRLLHKPALADSQRDLHGQSALPCGSAGQLQSGDVGAGNQQDGGDGCQQDQERLAQVSRHKVDQRHAEQAPACNLSVAVESLGSDLLPCTHGQIRIGLLERSVLAQPRNTKKKFVIALMGIKILARGKAYRHP